MGATRKKRFRSYLISKHDASCVMLEPRNRAKVPWCCPDSSYVHPIGHKKRKYLYVFACLDPSCEARLGITDTDFYSILEPALQQFISKGRVRRSAAPARARKESGR